MGAPAARARPAAKPRPRPATRPRTTPARASRRLTPVAAVGRTAVAVGGIADSGFVVGMSRSRLWIGVLCVLLGGIVAINVWGLGLSAGSSATAAKIDELQREASVLRGRYATGTSNDRIAAAAGELDLAVPAPNGVHYLDAAENDAERAAERLTNGSIEIAPPPAPQSAEEQAAAAEAAAVDPVAAAPIEPAVTATVDPVTGYTIDPASGLPIDPATGLAIDPATGLPPAP